MSFLKRLFGGGGGAPDPEASGERYKEFLITPTPIKEGTQWRISARIEKEVGGEVKSHTLVRADTVGDRETAEQFSMRKAKQAIDEQGERLLS